MLHSSTGLLPHTKAILSPCLSCFLHSTYHYLDLSCPSLFPCWLSVSPPWQLSSMQAGSGHCWLHCYLHLLEWGLTLMGTQRVFVEWMNGWMAKRDRHRFRVGLGSDQTSLTLIPGPNPGELPAGERAYQALVESVFWAQANQHLLTDGMLRDLWNGIQFQFHLSLDPWRQGKEGPKMCSSVPPAQGWDPTVPRGL